MNTTIQQTIISALQNGSWLTLFIVFWSGAILSLSSCTIIRVPIIIGYIGGTATSKKRALLLTYFFVIGLVLSYTLLGIIFALISGVMHYMVRWSRYFYYLIGIMAFFIGIQLAGIIDLGLFRQDKMKMFGQKKERGVTLLGAALFGFIFAIFEAPVCPCCGPLLFIMAGFARQNIPYAILIFIAYSLGQSLPLFLIGSFTSIVKYISPRVEKAEGIMKLVGGNILIAIGTYFFIVG